MNGDDRSNQCRVTLGPGRCVPCTATFLFARQPDQWRKRHNSATSTPTRMTTNGKITLMSASNLNDPTLRDIATPSTSFFASFPCLFKLLVA